MPAPLPPPELVADPFALQRLVLALASCEQVAVDTESNSLHAYRERVCLIQFSAPGIDAIVDPLALPDLSPLAAIFANPAQEKIFHAAENDLFSLARDFGFAFANIFDTMTAARTLGWAQVGLASILDSHFGITLDKKFQRADWGRRPLTSQMLDYARFDTHYLPALRERQRDALIAADAWVEAQEEFIRLTRVRVDAPSVGVDPMAFWRIKGAFDLPRPNTAILDALFRWREAQAERIDQPPFKVMSEAALLALARHAPTRLEDLARTAGLAASQVQRHGRALLEVIARGSTSLPPEKPAIEADPDDVRERYERLHAWRKARARARGVESDVILPRTTLRDLARRAPRTIEELETIADFGPWRRRTYGQEVLTVMASAPVRPSFV